MTANYHNIEAINSILLEILEDIVVGIMDGYFADENDEYLVYFITFFLSVINMGTSSSEDEQTTGSELKEHNPILEDAVRKDEENIEESISLHSDGLPSGDALFSATESEIVPISEAAPLGDNTAEEDDGSKMSEVVEGDLILLASSCMSSCGDAPPSESWPVDPTPTPEDIPLGDIRCADVLDEIIEPVKGMAVMNSFGELVGWLDPAVAPGKCDPPRRNRFSSRWKSVKRIFRALCGGDLGTGRLSRSFSKSLDKLGRSDIGRYDVTFSGGFPGLSNMITCARFHCFGMYFVRKIAL
ncbi:hypothetical protein QTP88_027501 [Uroleucon formosanum]